MRKVYLVALTLSGTLPAFAQNAASSRPASGLLPPKSASAVPTKVQYVPGTVNVGPDLILPPETQWNHFSPQLIPDFTVPTRMDPVIGAPMPVKAFLWHQPGRNMFRTVETGTDAEKFESERKAMFSKGITAVEYVMLRPTELGAKTPPVDPATQVGVGHSTAEDNSFIKDWDTWGAWFRKNVDEFAGPLQAKVTDGKAAIYLVQPDYEASQTAGMDQKAINHLTVGNYVILDKTKGYVSQMYLGPTSTLGYLTPEAYSGGGKTPAWFESADSSVPEAYRGKKNVANPRIVASLEVSNYAESWQPDGVMLKDQHGKDWFKLDHFGKTPNAEHWAARVGGLIETAQQYTHPAGQKLFPMLKISADRRSGFAYDPEGANAHEGKWNFDFNKHGAIHSGPNNTEFTGSIGAEMMPGFMAEAQMMLGYFSGADGIKYWGSSYSNDFHPKLREGNPQRGEKYNDPNYGNVDREANNYVLKALWRLNQKVTLENGEKVSFYDICDGTEEYLTWHTNVSYDDGSTFKERRALDWQFDKLTAVRAVINRQKKVIFVLAFQPYGVEQKRVVFKFEEGGFNFKKTIDVPVGKIMLCGYKAAGLFAAKPPTK